MHYIAWAQAHYGQALAVLGALATVLATFRNLATHLGWISPVTDSRLAKVADRLAWISQSGGKGIAGLFNLPGLASKPVLVAPRLSVVANEVTKEEPNP